MSGFLRDFRQGLRHIRNAPGAFAIAILALGLGIGANTAIFSVVKVVLLDRLPAQDPERLVGFVHHNEKRNFDTGATPYADVCEWRRDMRSFETIAAMQQNTAVLTGGDEPERVTVARVNADFFPMLGVRPVLGRIFSQEEDRPGAGRAAILTHELFTRRFGGKWQPESARIQIDDQSYAVAGVLPPRFRFTGQPADLYLPLALPEARGPGMAVTAFGRLKPGVTRQQAQVELDRATAATIARLPIYKGFRLQTRELREWISPDVKNSLWALLVGVGLLLLIACANVAGLLLARAAARRREIAVRAAMGAGRGRLARQMLAESVPLAALGLAIGLVFAAWAINLVPHLGVSRIPRLAESRIDGAMLAFTALVSLLTTLLFGLFPALASSRADLHESLKEGGRAGRGSARGSRARAALVIVEVALALVLSIGASLMMRTVYNLSNVDPGFNPRSLFTASVELPRAKFKAKEQVVAFFDRVLERVRALPGVQSAALTSSLPLGGNYFRGSFQVEGQQYSAPSEYPVFSLRTVDASYLKTLQIPLRRGRAFDAADRPGTPPVVMINETTAKRLFGGADPLGKHLDKMAIIGVTADIKHEDVSNEAGTELLLPFAQQPMLAMALAVRLDPRVYTDAGAFAPLMRRAIAEVDANLPVFRTGMLDKLMYDRLGARRLNMVLLGVFAALALLLAALGIYGMLAFAVARRSHEIGVRMAMGAQAGDVVRLVVRQSVLLAGTGLVIGCAAAAALAQVARSLLFGVSPANPWAFAGAALLLAAVAAAASWAPARRATRTDPVAALRWE